MHEPVALVVGWLRNSLVGITDCVASLLPDEVVMPAVAVVNATGAPVATAGGLDTVYDYTVTLYCFGGRTGAGQDYPDYQRAHEAAAAIVAACRTVASGHRWAGAGESSIVDAEVVAMTRAVDDDGGAIITITAAVRVVD